MLTLCSQLRFRKQSTALCRPVLWNIRLQHGVFSGSVVCQPGTRREIAVVFAGTRGTLIQSATDKRNGCESVGKKFCIMYNSRCYFSRVYERSSAKSMTRGRSDRVFHRPQNLYRFNNVIGVTYTERSKFCSSIHFQFYAYAYAFAIDPGLRATIFRIFT